ncbi:MAG: HupE/UreJ family protein, partial [Alphaproteobacteria bacterium]
GAASLGLLQVPLVVMLGLAGFAGAMALARRVDAGRIAPAVATLFGLAHGAGFAGPLLELKIAPENLVWTLLSFNLGVEAGQLVAVGVVVAFMAGLRAARIRLPAIALELSAALLFALGVFWFVSRSVG